MKQLNQKLILLFLIPSFLIFQNCSKDTLLSSKDVTLDILNSLKDIEDVENDKVTEIQYHFANAFNKLMSNNEINELLVSEVKKSGIGQIAILNFIESYDLKDQFNVQLLESLKNTRNFASIMHDDDLAVELANRMVHKDILYYPVLTFLQPNIDNLDIDKIAIGIGQELDDEENIYGFLGSGVIKLNDISIKSFDGILLIVNNHVDFNTHGDESNLGSKIAQQASNRTNSTSIKLLRYQVKNGYRYESRGDTDYRVKVYRNDTDVEWKTYSISKSQVSNNTNFFPSDVILQSPISFAPCDLNLLPNQCISQNELAVLTFEYDWNQSSKAFNVYEGNNCSSSNPVTNVSGRRKYWGDTYDFNMNEDSCWLREDQDDEIQLSSTKSTHEIQRIDL